MIPAKRLKVTAITAVLLAVLIFGLIQAYMTYEKNNETIRSVMQKTVTKEYNQEKRIKELDKLTELNLVDSSTKIELFTSLSMAYSLNQDYSEMIQSAVKSIYLADKKKEYYFSAWNYLNLSDTFMMMYDYDTAEAMINKAIQYDITDGEEDRWIKETAYISMADLKSKVGATQEALKYLELSMKYVVESAYDYEEMLLKRDIILSRVYWKEGNYEEAKNLLKDVTVAEAKDFVLYANVNVPLKEMQAKLEVVTGNLKKGEELCDEVLRLQEEKEYKAEELNFLKDIIPLFVQDKKAFDKYSAKTLQVYEDVMNLSNDLAVEYIFTIYGSRYKNFEDNTLKIMYIFTACIVTLLITALIVLLWISRRKNITDSLTGAYNRRYFERLYKRYLKRGDKFALLMIDVDFFKSVNDTFGHEFGDTVLMKFVSGFAQNRPSGAKLFRMGGEEFCVLYKCEKIEDSIKMGEKLRLEAEQMRWENGRTVTISLGLAFAGQAEDMYNLADKNLYESKKSGRNKLTYTKAGK